MAEFPCCDHCDHDPEYVHEEPCFAGCDDAEPEPGGATSAWEHHRG